jgi:hypothetical protein
MQNVCSRLGMLSAIAAIMGIGVVQVAGQEYRAPRGLDGKPDLNGIWQALNEANYDIEAHAARPALAFRPGPYGPVPAAPVLALGAVGAVPPPASASWKAAKFPIGPKPSREGNRTRAIG